MESGQVLSLRLYSHEARTLETCKCWLLKTFQMRNKEVFTQYTDLAQCYMVSSRKTVDNAFYTWEKEKWLGKYRKLQLQAPNSLVFSLECKVACLLFFQSYSCHALLNHHDRDFWEAWFYKDDCKKLYLPVTQNILTQILYRPLSVLTAGDEKNQWDHDREKGAAVGHQNQLKCVLVYKYYGRARREKVWPARPGDGNLKKFENHWIIYTAWCRLLQNLAYIGNEMQHF